MNRKLVPYTFTGPDGEPSEKGYWFYCPGCKCAHRYITWRKVPGRPIWSFDAEKVSFGPSLLIFTPGGKWEGEKFVEDGTRHHVCHLFLTEGQIRFLGDCDHDLKGQTSPLVDFPEGYQLHGVANG